VGVRVLAPDRPGYDGRPSSDFATNARALSVLLRDTGVDRAVIVGHSWGGGVALQLALDHPEQVAALCLVGSIGSRLSCTNRDRLLAWPVLAEAAAVATCVTAACAPRAFARATGSTLCPAALRDLRTDGRSWLRIATLRAIAAEQRVFVEQEEDVARRLAEVTAPALVITGAGDRTVIPAAAADLARALPNGTLITLPGGHLLPLEQPQLIADAVHRCVAQATW
jgi:pimeloyl-ACP methyl ester carboxylesterase